MVTDLQVSGEVVTRVTESDGSPDKKLPSTVYVVISSLWCHLFSLCSQVCPGWVRTSMGGDNATKSVEEGKFYVHNGKDIEIALGS